MIFLLPQVSNDYSKIQKVDASLDNLILHQNANLSERKIRRALYEWAASIFGVLVLVILCVS